MGWAENSEKDRPSGRQGEDAASHIVSPPPRGEGLGVGGSRSDPDLRTKTIGAPTNVRLARHFRNNASSPERRLWAWLKTLRREHGVHVRRQVPIGRYVADFGCHAARVVIELDGPFHDTKDATRDAWFSKAGYRTLRFSTETLTKYWDRNIAEIAEALGIRVQGPLSPRQPPTPNPSPQGGGE